MLGEFHGLTSIPQSHPLPVPTGTIPSTPPLGNVCEKPIKVQRMFLGFI